MTEVVAEVRSLLSSPLRADPCIDQVIEAFLRTKESPETRRAFRRHLEDASEVMRPLLTTGRLPRRCS